MTWLAIALALIGAVTGFVVTRPRRRPKAGALVPADLAARVDAAAAALVATPSLTVSTAGSGAVEAALCAGQPARALELAEAAVAAAPDDPVHRLTLAWALCANAQPTAALAQLAAARARGGGDGALAGYLAARAEHLEFEHAVGAIGPMPPLVTTADLAVVTLGRGGGNATWLTGSTDAQLSTDEVRAAIAGHRDVTARCLVRALDALAVEPGFVDGAYLVARLAVKAGLPAPGRRLLDAIAPRIDGRPDATAFARDRADLDDPAAVVAAARTAPVRPTARRSRALKVL